MRGAVSFRLSCRLAKGERDIADNQSYDMLRKTQAFAILTLLLAPSLLSAQSEDFDTRYFPSQEVIAERGVKELRMKVMEINGESVDSGSNYRYTYWFDTAGRMTRASLPEYPWTSCDYDSLGRITRSSINGLVQQEGPRFGDTIRMSVYFHYDESGEMTRETSDYSRFPTVHSYDPVTGYRIRSHVEGSDGATTYHYTQEGLLGKELFYRNDTDLVYGKIYKYGAVGEVVAELSLDGQVYDSAVDRITLYSYDERGNLIHEVTKSAYQRGDTTSEYRYTWDESGLMQEAVEDYHSGSRPKVYRMRFEYEYYAEEK